MSKLPVPESITIVENGNVVILDTVHLQESTNSWLIKKGLYVYKIPKPDDDSKTYERRKKRLKNEVEALKRLQSCREVIPVISSGLGKEGNHIHQFYKMPQCKKLSELSRQSVVDLFKQFVSLANALSSMHTNGLFHRDIKPDNILHYAKEGCLVFSDFGLVTGENIKSITGPHEHVGPRYFSPPEFSDATQIKLMKSDARWSSSADFYMFAKTIWAFLRYHFEEGNSLICFGGEFNRRKADYRLSEDACAVPGHGPCQNGAPNLEPFYDFMDGTTKNDHRGRLSDSKAVDLLKQQADYLNAWLEGQDTATPSHKISAALDGIEGCVSKGEFAREAATIYKTLNRLKPFLKKLEIRSSNESIAINNLEFQLLTNGDPCIASFDKEQSTFSLKGSRFKCKIKTLLVFADHVEIEAFADAFEVENDTRQLTGSLELWI